MPRKKKQRKQLQPYNSIGGDYSMYKKHKIIIFIAVFILFIIAFYYKIDASAFSSVNITLLSVNLITYIVSFSKLIPSEMAEKMKRTEDTEIKGKSQLGVLRAYLHTAVVTGILNIILNCILLIYNNNNTFYYILSAVAFSLLGLNLILMYLLYKFIINRLIGYKKEQCGLDISPSTYFFTAKKIIEEDNSITLSLNEIDLIENAPTEAQARELLAISIIEYAQEYSNNYNCYSQSPNRKKHIPYIIRALVINDVQKLAESIVLTSNTRKD